MATTPFDARNATESDKLLTSLRNMARAQGATQLAKGVEATDIFNALTALPDDFMAGGREDVASQDREEL